MTIPHYINEDRSEMRGIKPGWYAMDDAGKLSSGPFCSHEECLSRGPTDFNLKVIEIARTNTNTAFDNACELLGVKSPSEFAELSTKHAHKQIEAMTAQTKELMELAQKVTTENHR
ncbi:MAG: phasin family protein [Pseudolabrys sp.]